MGDLFTQHTHAWHSISHPICMAQYPNLRYVFGVVRIRHSVSQSIYSIPHLFYLSSKTNCIAASHRAARLPLTYIVCVWEYTWHVLVHIWTFDSKSIVNKLRIHGSRAYRQRQLRISHRVSYFFLPFTFHIFLFFVCNDDNGDGTHPKYDADIFHAPPNIAQLEIFSGARGLRRIKIVKLKNKKRVSAEYEMAWKRIIK